jgi:hypothetical protein
LQELLIVKLFLPLVVAYPRALRFNLPFLIGVGIALSGVDIARELN